MSNEPIFNIEEPAPLYLIGVLIIAHLLSTYAPASFRTVIFNLLILVPLEMPQVPLWRQFVSLPGHGLLHAGWGHLLMNSAMILIFAVMTFRGLRLHFLERQKPQLTVMAFWAIFVIGTIGAGLFQWGWWALANIPNSAALGASGGASALFATAAWALGGRTRLISFGLGWALLNIIFVAAEPLLGPIAWAAHIGGYITGAMLAPYWVKPFSTGFSITR